jgi:hypothetical protein
VLSGNRRIFKAVFPLTTRLIGDLPLPLIMRRYLWLQESSDLLGAQLFECAHKDRFCVRAFVGVSVRVL